MIRYILLISGLLICKLTVSQNSVTFRVTEGSGEVLAGASIVIRGSTTGKITDQDGSAFFENLPGGRTSFEISFVGYEERVVTLSFPESHNKIVEIVFEGGQELEEVIISTTRSSRSIQDLPTRIEAITSEELGEKAAMNSSNIGMLLRETTGVQMQQTSLSSGNMSIRIQGLDGRYTQILKDGFPIYGGFAGGLSIMQIPPLDLHQVELIKGSSSTLYGGGAIAGLVNLISIKPEEDPVLDLMLNQTSAKGTTANLFYAGRSAKTGLSVYGAFSNQVAYDPDNDGFSDMPESQTWNFNPKFYYYINPSTELSLGLNTAFDKRTGGDIEVLKGNGSDQHVFFEKNRSDRYSTQLNFTNETETRTINFKQSLSFFRRDLTFPAYIFNGEQLSSFSEALYSLHRNEDSEWQFGANHYLEKFNETGSIVSRDYEYNTVGAFLQNTTTLSPKFVFECGLRTDYNNDFGIFFLPRISLMFKANKNLTSRIGGAMGYKLPTIFTEEAEQLYFRGVEPLNAELAAAETSTGANLDINYRAFLSDKMSFSLNQFFFLTQLQNALVLRGSDFPGTYFFESADGDILSSGFETNVKLTYSDFRLFINYAFINTDLRYDNINKQKPLTPKHNLGFALIYEIEDKWSAGYELYYTGQQFDNLYNRKSDYWIMGFMLMRMFEKFSLFINFENFTDTHQSDFEPLVRPPVNDPVFSDIWAPTDGFVFNAGIKLRLK